MFPAPCRQGGGPLGILIFIVVLITVVVLFSVQNASPVAVTFLVWKFDASLAIVIFLSLVTGILIGAVITLWARRRPGPKRTPPPEEQPPRSDAPGSRDSD
jgi:uncharacterized integral membrane protein